MMCIVVNAQENPSFDNEIINETPGLNETQNQTGVVPSGLIGFQLAGIEPKEANPGDVVVTINVVNTGTVALNNLMPVVVGRGFSAYNIVPIALLNPNQTAPAYIEGKFREKGEILLAIKISDKVFYEKVSIKAEPYFVNETKLKEMEEARQDELIDLSAKLDDLKAKYISLETDLQNKEGDYDVSRVKLDELKGYLRTSESSLLSGDAEKTKINIALANNEYVDQKRLIDESKKKPFMQKIKDNIIVISSIAGAIITLFALYELLKKKKEGLYQKIKEIKINKDTTIVVQKKKKGKGDKK